MRQSIARAIETLGYIAGALERADDTGETAGLQEAVDIGGAVERMAILGFLKLLDLRRGCAGAGGARRSRR